MRGLGTHRPNLKKIATAAGVSSAAVSLALNNKPGVSKELSRRILTIAAQMGYERDAKLAELMAHIAGRRPPGEHSTLALVTHHDQPRFWEVDPSLLPLWEGARHRAKELGYRVEEILWNEPGMTPRRLREILLSRGIRGLLFSMTPPRAPVATLDFDLSGFSAAAWDLCGPTQALSYVAPDHFSNLLTCLQRAYDLGYRRPLLALSERVPSRTLQLLQGAYFSFAHQHPELAPLPFFSGNLAGVAPLRAHLEKHRPDVVLSTENCRESGSFRDTAWISLNRMPVDAHLAGLDSLAWRRAELLVDLVVTGLHREECGDAEPLRGVLTPGVFIDGSSLPPKYVVSTRVATARAPARQAPVESELAGHGWP